MSKTKKDKKNKKNFKKTKKSDEGHTDRKKHQGTEFGTFAALMDGLVGAINIKLFIFLFIILILYNTSEFIHNVIGKFDGVLDGRHLNTKGIMIQASMITITLMLVDALISEDLL